jgi:hypothetical protein
MCEEFALNSAGKRAGCCTTTMHRFHQDILYPKQHDFHPPPTLPPHFAPCNFLLFAQLNIPHFDTIEVIEADSKVVLNLLVEHDFQDAFKK